MSSLAEHYSALYSFQDEVLKKIEAKNSSFYLTGGTALSRVYLNHRYSDDLDLFTNYNPNFEKESKALVSLLENFYSERLKIQINQDHFKRFFIEYGNNERLKIELINDVPYRVGTVTAADLFHRVDCWENILTNKISALSRNAEKDLADLLFLAYHYSFNWKTMIAHAKEKDEWVDEVKVAQYFSDIEALSDVKWLPENSQFGYNISNFKTMASDVLKGADNSLAR